MLNTIHFNKRLTQLVCTFVKPVLHQSRKNKLFCHMLVKNEEMTHTAEVFVQSKPSPAVDLIVLMLLLQLLL